MSQPQQASFFLPQPPAEPVNVYRLWCDHYGRFAFKGQLCAKCARRLVKKIRPTPRMVLDNEKGTCCLCEGLAQ